ncbi:hypothetical protein [Acholeplasma granularum]|uniref:hypothetical protein n=1 Tax=Acholeplasma granularum TaxID=264635 RepID=UPI000472D233|nr:hypothetical protein [Acholeplasma granularum]
MKKESWGFLLIGSSYIIKMLSKIVESFMDVSLSFSIEYRMYVSIITVLIMLIGILLIVIDNKSNIFILISSILLLVSPFSSLFTTWLGLGFKVDTLAEKVLIVQAISFAPILLYLFLLSFYKRITNIGKTLTIVYILISFISLVVSFIVTSLINNLPQDIIRLHQIIFNGVLFYVQTLIILGVLTINFDYTLAEPRFK